MALDLYDMTCGSVETCRICYLVLSHPRLMLGKSREDGSVLSANLAARDQCEDKEIVRVQRNKAEV